MLNTTHHLSDLLAQVASGDRVAFREVYAATSAKLYGVILRILKRRDIADEILQEVYVKVWERSGDFDPSRASPITWMSTIARNRALDEVRRPTALAIDDTPAAFEVRDPAMSASEVLERSQELERLFRCLDTLDPNRREIVRLAYLDGMSREDLAQRFGHPVPTIKTWLHRSLKQLKDCLAP
jgi:RNA polymerase sigma-70 factor, ECF subfamily